MDNTLVTSLTAAPFLDFVHSVVVLSETELAR